MGACSIRTLFINTNEQTACLCICLLNKDSGAALIGLLFINRPVYKQLFINSILIEQCL